MPFDPIRSVVATGPLRSKRDPEVLRQSSSNEHAGSLDWRFIDGSSGGEVLTTLAAAATSAGLGIAIYGVASVLPSAQWNAFAPWAIWLGLCVGVILAASRARPAPLFQLRSVDLLWGIGLGTLLRMVQGWMSNADSQPFPASRGGDATTVSNWLSYGIGGGLAGPLLEELFFRGVILICVFRLLRLVVGKLSASVGAALTSAALFVMLHSLSVQLSPADVAQLVIVGGTCASLVLLTGRIWGAVVAHIVYNVSYLVLMAIGTALQT